MLYGRSCKLHNNYAGFAFDNCCNIKRQAQKTQKNTLRLSYTETGEKVGICAVLLSGQHKTAQTDTSAERRLFRRQPQRRIWRFVKPFRRFLRLVKFRRQPQRRIRRLIKPFRRFFRRLIKPFRRFIRRRKIRRQL